MASEFFTTKLVDLAMQAAAAVGAEFWGLHPRPRACWAVLDRRYVVVHYRFDPQTRQTVVSLWLIAELFGKSSPSQVVVVDGEFVRRDFGSVRDSLCGVVQSRVAA